MTSATTSYGQLFVHRGLQVSQQTSFCISPDGLRLLSSTTSGTLMVVDTRIGHAQIIVDTGSDSLVTSIVWVNNSQALLATHDGHLFSISFKNAIAGSIPNFNISYVMQDLKSPVRAMAYDMTQHVLVVGYQSSAVFWNLSSAGTKFLLLDRVSIRSDTSSQGLINTIQFFGQPEQRVFIGGGFGYVVWSRAGQVVFHSSESVVPPIGNSAVSPDGQFLSVSTLDHIIQVWPLTANGPRLDVQVNDYAITSGCDYLQLKPRTPLTSTHSNLTVSGSQVGQIALVSTTGELVHDFFFEHDLSVQGILAFEERLYVAFNGPAESVIVVGYSCNADHRRSVEGLRSMHEKKLSNTLKTKIHLSQVVAVSPSYHQRQQRFKIKKATKDASGHRSVLILLVILFTVLTSFAMHATTLSLAWRAVDYHGLILAFWHVYAVRMAYCLYRYVIIAFNSGLQYLRF